MGLIKPMNVVSVEACHQMSYVKLKKKKNLGDFPCGPAAKTLLPVQGTWVQSLVRELDPTCQN